MQIIATIAIIIVIKKFHVHYAYKLFEINFLKEIFDTCMKLTHIKKFLIICMR